jgi:hypothetical protein
MPLCHGDRFFERGLLDRLTLAVEPVEDRRDTRRLDVVAGRQKSRS